jgi:ankyrin repeat protein
MAPLHWAAQLGHLELVTLLLERGASVNATTVVRCCVCVRLWLSLVSIFMLTPIQQCVSTPLYYAAQSGHVAVVALLLDRGAEIDATPWVRACARAHAWPAHAPVPRARCMPPCAEPPARAQSWTALMEAIQAGHVEVATLLLARGADKDFTTYVCAQGQPATARAWPAY